MSLEPGCFGAASVFSHDSHICRQCECFAACSSKSLETLWQIGGLVDVTDILKRHEEAKRRLGKHFLDAGAKVVEQPVPEPKGAPSAEPKGCKSEPAAAPAEPTIKTPVERKTPLEKVVFGISAEDQAIIDGIAQKKAREAATKLCSQGLMHKLVAELKEGRNALSTRAPAYQVIAVDGLLAGGFSKSELKELYVDNTNMNESAAASHTNIAMPMLVAFGIAQENAGRYILNPALRS